MNGNDIVKFLQDFVSGKLEYDPEIQKLFHEMAMDTSGTTSGIQDVGVRRLVAYAGCKAIMNKSQVEDVFFPAVILGAWLEKKGLLKWGTPMTQEEIDKLLKAVGMERVTH